MLVLHTLNSHYRFTGGWLEVFLVKVIVHDVIDTHPDVLNSVRKTKRIPFV